MVKSHTAEAAELREEFRNEIERKLAEQKKDMKVKITQVQHILITIVKLRMWLPQDEYARSVKIMMESHTASLREEFRKEIDRKLVEQNDMQVKNHPHNWS